MPEMVLAGASNTRTKVGGNDPALRRTLLVALAVCVSYYLTSKIGFAFALQPGSVSILWMPNSIVLAGLLVIPRRWWWLVLLAAFPAHFASELQSGVPTGMVLSWFASNSAQAIIGAFCICQLVEGQVQFGRLRDVTIFILFGVFLAPFLSTFLDLALVRLNGWGTGPYWEIWRVRFLSNVLATVTLVPAALVWSSGGIAAARRASFRRYVEAGLLMASLFAVGLFVFTSQLGTTDKTPALLYWPLPFLLWASVRFGPAGASTSLLVVMFVTISGATHGHGPFVASSSLENALAIQWFLIVVSIPMMTLAAVIEEWRSAEKTARQNEERLTLALNAAQMGSWDWQISDDRLTWSEDTSRVFALPAPEPDSTLESGLNMIHPEDRDSVEAAIRRAVENRSPYEVEFRITSGGTTRWVLSKGRVSFDEAGRPSRLVGLGMDITERKQAEGALTESEERYRNVVESQTEMVCRYLPDSTLTFVNDAYCRYFGKSRSELIGTKFVELLPEHNRAATISHISSLLENPRVEIYEHEVYLPDGTIGWQQWVDHVLQDSKGEGPELQGIGRDITAHRRVEEALRASETRFSVMADSAPVMIWMSGPDKMCTYFNQGWLSFTGRSLAEELGMGWAAGVHEDDYVRCLQTYNTAFDRKASFNMEYRLRRADGVFRWVYDSGTPRFTSEGEFLGYIGSCIDIADRKEAEEALRKAHDELNHLKNQLQAENVYLQEEIKLAHNADEIVGQSNAIKYVLFKVEQVSKTDTTVLILGETGTGKELIARAIHSQSQRNDRPLVKVNCAALSANLIESELFGHEKGAFTGASARKIGRFELANGATIFLDEIGEVPPELQAKLLRVVQEGEFERLGGTKTIKVDVRILAATNRNLRLEVEKGRFREDLWYRLNVFPITVPPLRQRKEDIPQIVEHFVRWFSKKIGKEITSISASTLKKLQDYSWPGNVRELANIIERSIVNAQGPVLHIPDQFEKPQSELPPSTRTLEDMEKEHILRVLDGTSWRIEGANGAARILGLNPSTLRSRMVKLGIQKTLRTNARTSLRLNRHPPESSH